MVSPVAPRKHELRLTNGGKQSQLFQDTTTKEVFKTWLDDLYRKYSVEIPKRDKSVLFTKRASGPDKRFETHISEWRCLER